MYSVGPIRKWFILKEKNLLAKHVAKSVNYGATLPLSIGIVGLSASNTASAAVLSSGLGISSDFCV